MKLLIQIVHAVREPSTEPALIRALVAAVFGVLAAFGLAVSDQQQAAVAMLVMVVVALIQGKSTREHVMPYNWEDFDYQGDEHEDLEISDGDELPTEEE